MIPLACAADFRFGAVRGKVYVTGETLITQPKASE